MGPRLHSFEVLFSFNGRTDGYGPMAGLLADKAGNLYGTTLGAGSGGCGTVFKLAPDGTFTVLHNFAAGADGDGPVAGLVSDAAGNLYGTTESGGGPIGGGIVFKVTPDGTETVLHSFGGKGDGSFPQGGLVLVNGNLYGTTFYGGRAGRGIVFQVTPDGNETVIYSFLKAGNPWASLIADQAGNLYGTAYDDGAHYLGAIFEVSPTEQGKFRGRVLRSFTRQHNDGGNPRGTLALDKAGNLYGTSSFFGANGVGNIFKLAPDRQLTVLYSFTVGNGYAPYGGVIADAAGNLYGTTSAGGAGGVGAIYEVAPDGAETVLHSFTGGGDGGVPMGSLITDDADQQGYLYGTTSEGGTNGAGSVFRIRK
jgi:uncharacterized repeat protein (TIGR03803 family)